jgi:hypothetical protein
MPLIRSVNPKPLPFSVSGFCRMRFNPINPNTIANTALAKARNKIFVTGNKLKNILPIPSIIEAKANPSTFLPSSAFVLGCIHFLLD